MPSCLRSTAADFHPKSRTKCSDRAPIRSRPSLAACSAGSALKLIVCRCPWNAMRAIMKWFAPSNLATCQSRVFAAHGRAHHYDRCHADDYPMRVRNARSLCARSIAAMCAASA
jgi:hypothetical protein